MNFSHGPLRFLAEGRDVLRDELTGRLRLELREKHRRELAVSGLLGGLLLEWRIEREVRRRARLEMPSKGSVFVQQG
ncbi:MAG TPA: hypothetical protein VGE39_13390 [Prosthecobacter sp.]